MLTKYLYRCCSFLSIFILGFSIFSGDFVTVYAAPTDPLIVSFGECRPDFSSGEINSVAAAAEGGCENGGSVAGRVSVTGSETAIMKCIEGLSN